MAEVIFSLRNPQIRKVRPVPSYRGTLTIGSPYEYPDDAIVIDVERYPRTKRAAAITASKYLPPTEGETPSQGGGVGLQRTYRIKRGNEDVEVEKEELEKGYLYGRTIVPLSDADQGIVKLETNAELTIIGFIEMKGVRYRCGLSDTSLNDGWR
jgi:ATP-dependent DNA helicase 2 subunit 2